MQEHKSFFTVLVTGDVTMDWNIAHQSSGLREPTEWTGSARSNMSWQFGSAVLLADLIKTMTHSRKGVFPFSVNVIPPQTPRQSSVRLADPRYVRSYAIWAQYRDKEAEENKKIILRWRVQRFLGLDLPFDGTVAKRVGHRPPNDPSSAEIVVIDDSNLGFRNKGEHWPHAIDCTTNNQKAPWIIVKMSTPVAEGELWKHLVANFPDRLIAVLTIDDLRQSRIRVSARISWEKTVEEINRELIHNPAVNGLTNAAYTIISFGPTGALIIPGRHNTIEQPTLLFDPRHMEEEWGQGEGMMIGKTSALVMGIVYQIMLKSDKPDLIKGIQCGVTAMRHLQKEGYEDNGDSITRLHFPLNSVISTLNSNKEWLEKITLPTNHLKGLSFPSSWTILRESALENLEQLYKDIVLYGVEKAIKGVPIGKFGKLETVDRQEIESLKSIQSLIAEYCNRNTDRPLSISVFGPPGSGKSFAVEEIAKIANPDKIAEKTLTFNLSQFNSPDELTDAFHQIRDVCLSGKIPLVFWDEFDSTLDNKKLGWLRFFLAPMQDGKFQQGEITHPIGKAIFVFAGGTYHNMNDFMLLLYDYKNDEKHDILKKNNFAEAKALEDAISNAKDAKVPDFHSRLKGFLDVLGPNRKKINSNHCYDSEYVFRRAILLRSFLIKLAPHLFDKNKKLLIDPGVLRAFLKIDEYRHGARSMESIIAMSRLGQANQFNRSYLPPEEQLSLHVDPKVFIALLHNLELEGELLEILAKLHYKYFCQDLINQGYEWGEVLDEKVDLKKHSMLIEYDNLTDHEKEKNRRAVREIPNELAAYGYIMVPRRNNEIEYIVPLKYDDKIKKISILLGEAGYTIIKDLGIESIQTIS